MTSYKAKIIYKIYPTHPDIKGIKDYSLDKVFEYEDVYRFNPFYYHPSETERMKKYMKDDLSLVAGGGYNADHIHDVRFEFKRITETEETRWTN